ncbi:hypothetical protein CFP65_2563 [Kitasatospora sp. MMS16-BH015]|uniref:hypothetical protein n=1 Tax=Kitasatospora sp. MMS16-BH015 TaxID=2018025 RepID=UPI000CA25B08|nr:hypothetical protein [Kitasatospora sp. MMS16-BH015]AUG77389.1 hypothetical protein CFP65_2563 [Kitasatospora sp. MMS16-BH015]
MARKQQRSSTRQNGRVTGGRTGGPRRAGGAVLGAAAVAAGAAGLAGFAGHSPVAEVSAGVSRLAAVGESVPFAVADWDAAGTGAALAALAGGVGSVVVIRRRQPARDAVRSGSQAA